MWYYICFLYPLARKKDFLFYVFLSIFVGYQYFDKIEIELLLLWLFLRVGSSAWSSKKSVCSLAWTGRMRCCGGVKGWVCVSSLLRWLVGAYCFWVVLLGFTYFAVILRIINEIYLRVVQGSFVVCSRDLAVIHTVLELPFSRQQMGYRRRAFPSCAVVLPWLITKGLIWWLLFRCSERSLIWVFVDILKVLLNHWRLPWAVCPIRFLIELNHRETRWCCNAFLCLERREVIRTLEHMVAQDRFALEYWLWVFLSCSSCVTSYSRPVVLLVEILKLISLYYHLVMCCGSLKQIHLRLLLSLLCGIHIFTKTTKCTELRAINIQIHIPLWLITWCWHKLPSSWALRSSSSISAIISLRTWRSRW